MKYQYKDLELYKQLHKERSYGDTGVDYIEDVLDFITQTKAETVLDFGSGTGSLAKNLRQKNILVDEFDPCYPGKEKISKEKYDLIITTDLLEHIYEDELNNIFEEMLYLKPKFMYHAISTREATILLPDQTNCHKTIKSMQWWYDRIYNLTNPTTINTEPKNDDCVIIKLVL
jgi:2-polyprenyl-3-methyl-5-hydroxy-6-metoxy-1,4-benzoquinol methylase